MRRQKRDTLSDIVTAYRSETLAWWLHACAVNSVSREDYWHKAIHYTSDEAAIEAAWSKHVR